MNFPSTNIIFEANKSRFDRLAADLLDKLLVFDPNKRLTAEEALAHPYFKTQPLPALPQSYPNMISDDFCL